MLKHNPRYALAIALAGTALLNGCSDRAGTNPARSGGEVLEALSVTSATVVAAVDFMTPDSVQVPVTCGGSFEVNCTGGTPGSPVWLRLVRVGVVTATSTGPATFSFTADYTVTSVQDIPVAGSGVSCGVDLNSGLGTSPTVTVNGTATFVSNTDDGVINRVDLTGSAEGLEEDDITLNGGFDCEVASAFQGAVVGLIEGMMDSSVRLCGAAGAETFRECPAASTRSGRPR